MSKTKSRADQRLVELSLTRAGRDMIRQMTPVALEFERDFLARLGTDNVVFRAALDTLLADDGHKS